MKPISFADLIMSQEDLQYNGVHEDDDDTEMVKNEATFPGFFHWEDTLFQKQTMSALSMMRQNKQFCDVTLRVTTGFL